MKTVKLMMCFFKKNPVLLLFVFLELTISMILFSDQIGELQYQHYSLELYQNSGLAECDHFTSLTVPGLTESPDDTAEAVFEAVRGTDGVEAIGISQSFTGIDTADLDLERELQRKYVVSVLTPSVFGSLPLKLSDGTWQPKETITDSTVNVVACGELAVKHRVGDIISIAFNDNSGTENIMKLKVVGRVAPPGFSVSLNMSSNAFSADNLFSICNCFIAVQTQSNYAVLSMFDPSYDADRGMMIRYKQDLDPASLEQARASLRSWGYLTTPDEIVENTKTLIRRDLNERFPMLMFFLIISSFSMISSVIVTQMKMCSNNAVYYLCGSTARRCFLYSGIPAALVGILALLVNIGRIAYYHINLDFWHYSKPKVLNGTTIAIVAAYFTVTIFIAILASYYVFQKNTPIEIYRKNK